MPGILSRPQSPGKSGTWLELCCLCRIPSYGDWYVVVAREPRDHCPEHLVWGKSNLVRGSEVKENYVSIGFEARLIVMWCGSREKLNVFWRTTWRIITVLNTVPSHTPAYTASDITSDLKCLSYIKLQTFGGRNGREGKCTTSKRKRDLLIKHLPLHPKSKVK